MLDDYVAEILKLREELEYPFRNAFYSLGRYDERLIHDTLIIVRNVVLRGGIERYLPLWRCTIRAYRALPEERRERIRGMRPRLHEDMEDFLKVFCSLSDGEQDWRPSESIPEDYYLTY
jgi:hypothetical protein